MTITLKISDPVGAWVIEHPATSRVFERHGIDYCCGGSRPLQVACLKKKVDLQAVLAELEEVASNDSGELQDDFSAKSLTEMCDSIEATHHQYLKRELPRLIQLVNKVVSVHGDHYQWLTPLAESFRQLHDELVPHLQKEEQVLFPAIRTFEQAQAEPSFPFGSIDNPIRMMEHEHDVAGQALRDIRAASSDFTLPEGGCNTFRAMLDGLRELEADLHQHVHKENNILFPRASRFAADQSISPASESPVQ